MRRSLAAAAAILAALALTLASASAGGAKSAGTTVVVASNTVDIHVVVDVLVDGPGALAGRDASAIAAEAAKVAALWNDAFAKYQNGCLTLHLDLTMNPIVNPTEGSAFTWKTRGGLTYPITQPGHHVAVWSAFDTTTRPTVWDPSAASAQPQGDYTAPYTNDLPAQWDDQLLDVNALAHEIGHLMGLGDDYVDQSDGTSVSLPGRTDTLMADLGPIDQALVNRIASIIGKAGYTLPTCKVWEGPIHLDASVIAKGGSDHGTGDGTIRLAEEAKTGLLEGTVSVNRTAGCNLATGKKSWVIPVVGRLKSGDLIIAPRPGTVVTASEAGVEPICGFPDGFLTDVPGEPHGSDVSPIVARLTSQTAASGSGSLDDNEQADESSPSKFFVTTHYTVSLRRK